MMNYKIYILSFTAAIMLLSCGSGTEKQPEVSEKVETAPLEAAVEESVPASVTLTIEGNDAMQFNLKEMKVVEGQKVTLILKHVGKLPMATMGHNWVLLKPGTDIQTFGMAAMTATDTDYIPQDMIDQVIIHTKMIGGGEEISITFDAPKMGYYKFICSFPGHFGAMQGSFVVEPK